MKATVLVRPKQRILDPQGDAVESALGHLEVDDLADPCAGDGEAEMLERALNRFALRVEDARLRPHEDSGLHPSTTDGSSRYTWKGIVVSRSNAST